MENKDSSAYPTSETTYGGLTKREDFAKAALQGLLVNAGRNGIDFHSCAAEAVRQADALLFELDK
jgi:hypothetical protein